MITHAKLQHILEYAKQQRHIGLHCKVPPEDMVEIVEAAMQAEPVTAATVPDGWTANSDANAALVMLDRIDTIDCADDERIEAIKSIIRRLAAAPEQEV